MKDWIWYAGLQTLSPIQKKKLLDIYVTPANIVKLELNELTNISFLRESNIKELQCKRNDKLLLEYEKYMKKCNIQIIPITNENYPEKLKNIYDPPICLFAKGDINLMKMSAIAEIGCREPSQYGHEVAHKFAYALAKKNIVVVSGMAKGIDGISHKGALDANGKTIAVLGCGIDIVYPLENIEIYKNILAKGGLIISEFLVGTKPKPKNFPMRNRIISGLSDGVLVIEAKQKSGTMITVDFALDQGRNVYVVPGNINSIYSEGANALIKQGAKLVSNIEDIIEDYC